MSSRLITADRSIARRPGYTLIEMLIVCAVLAALAGISWPAMRGMLGKARLQHAADELQTALRKARVRAIRSGVATAFLYEPGGRRYRIGDWDAVSLPMEHGESTGRPDADEEFAAGDDRMPPAQSTSSTIESELPDGVRFLPVAPGAPGLAVDAGITDEPAASPLSDSGVEPQWSAPIVFRANGRGDDSEVRLVDDRWFSIDVSLRGLSGIVTASAPRRLTDPDGQAVASVGDGPGDDSEPKRAP